MEVPVYGRSGRRRSFRPVLLRIPHHTGTAYHEYGVRSGQSQPQESGKGLSGSGETRQQVAYTRISDTGRLLSADDVLYDGSGLDAALFLSDCSRKVRGSRFRCCCRYLHRYACKSGDHGFLDDRRSLRMYFRMRQRSSERTGTYNQDNDDSAAGYNGDTGDKQFLHVGSEGRFQLLSAA